MKTYHITATRPAHQVFYFSVTAESEEKALKMIQKGEALCSDYEVIDEPEIDSELTVIAETEVMQSEEKIVE